MQGRLPSKITRRKFLNTASKWVIGTTGILAGNTALFVYGADQQDKANKQTITEIPGHIVKLGEFDRLNAIMNVEKVIYEATFQDGWVKKTSKGFVYVTKGSKGDLLIISSVCTHLGCDVLPATIEQRSAKKDLFFLCPCHGAEFDKQGSAVGVVLKGLDTYQPIIADGSVYIDMMSPIKGI
ncbi:ubiquinol-cytochrome c reductase iron-sulfur subunit [Paenibacillus sp. TAF58]